MAIGGLFKFSDIFKMISLNPKIKKGCIVDTSILFAMSYPNDSFNTAASLEQLIKRIFSERYDLRS
jgi:hypothetical protein